LLWIGIAGLTGIPSVLLFPAFLLRGWLDRSQLHLACGIVLALCTAFHMVVILLAENTNRSFTFDIESLLLALALQGGLVNLVGLANGQEMATALRDHPTWFMSAAVLLGYTALFVMVLWCAMSGRTRVLTFVVGCLWIGTALVQAFGGLGDPSTYVSNLGGARYFLTASVCLALCLALGTHSHIRARHAFATLTLLAMVAVASIDRLTYPTVPAYRSGPDWRTEIASCTTQVTCEVEVWPGGPDWRVILPLKP
jgi:hypothetical protein